MFQYGIMLAACHCWLLSHIMAVGVLSVCYVVCSSLSACVGVGGCECVLLCALLCALLCVSMYAHQSAVCCSVCLLLRHLPVCSSVCAGFV